MPKERIQSITVPEFDVTVSWNRDGTVQVATVANDGVERARRCINEGPNPNGDEFDGWHVDLDRPQINELIRVLRRARDQAFGRDE